MAEDHAWIGGERVPLTSEHKPQRPVSEQMDDALTRLHEPPEDSGHDDDRAARDLRNVDDGYAVLSTEKEAARESAEREEAERQRQASEEADKHIAAATEWPEADQQVLGNLEQRVQQFNEAQQQLDSVRQRMKEAPDQFSAEDKRVVAHRAQQLQQEEAAIKEAVQEVQQAVQAKRREADRRKLTRDVPELSDSATRREFIEWGKAQGVPEDAILSEMRRDVIGPVFKKFQNEKAEARKAHINRPRKPVIREGALSRGGSTPEAMTTDQARQRLSTNGSMADAVNLLAIERSKRNDRNG